MTRTETIEACVNAARRPCPAIVPRAMLRHNGHVYSVMGGLPHGVKIEDCEQYTSFAYQDKDGHTFGHAQPSEQEARDIWRMAEDSKAAKFRDELEAMNEAQLASQANYWLKVREQEYGTPAPVRSAAVQIGSYKGKPTISLDAASKYPFTFGLGKAKLIVEHFAAIKKFVDSQSPRGDRFDMDVEDRMAEACR